MFQLVGWQVFYMGCLGLGFAYLTGSLMLSGIGGRGGGRGGRGGGRSGGARVGSSAKGGMRSSARGSAKGGSTKAMHGAPVAKIGGNRAPAGKVGSSAKAGSSAKSGGKSQARNGSKLQHGELQESVDSVCLEKASHAFSKKSEFGDRLFFSILSVFNPMFLSLFLFSFGAAGLVIERAFRISEELGMGLAALAAIFLAFQFQNFMGWFSEKLECSTVESLDHALGSVGEVTISIPKGKFGEIMLVVGLTRTNYSAKASDPELAIKSGTQVYVVEIENGIALVDVLEPEA